VGGPMHLTINWDGTANTLLSNEPPVVDRLHVQEPPEVLNELLGKVKDFRRAYEMDGLLEEEFASFGPVVLFRNSFITGWNYLLDKIREIRNK
jgi:transaldolase